MHSTPVTSADDRIEGVPRRRLLGAAALFGATAAVGGAAATAGPAEAAVVLGSRADTTPLPLRGTVVGRHRDLFRTFNLTSSTGVGVLTVGSKHYLMSTNTGDGTDTVQVFDAATGALHYKASTPGSAGGNFVHDGKGTIWFSSGTALMTLSVTGRSIRRYGTAPSGVTGLYDFVLDHRGRLWAGTYPAGAAVCLDPATGAELARTPRLGHGNDYVRSLSVSPDGRTLWAGTGTADPDLFRIDVDAPSTPVRVPIPGRGLNSFVLRTAARGRKVFVWHDNSSGTEVVSVHDTVSGSWGPAPTSMSGRSISAVDAAGHAYVNSQGTLMRLRPGDAVLSPEAVATVPDRHTWHTGLAGDTVLVVSAGNAALSAVPVSPGGDVRPRVDCAVSLTTLDTSSMVVDPATDTAYAGGFRGDGLCATALATGAFAHSAATAGISQIEGMVPDRGTLYVGSYGSAVVVAHETAPGVSAAGAYRRLATLGTSHLQSRIFAWASAESHVVFGTVPEYGYRGGALGTVERATGRVTVYNKLIPELSIVGLAASGHTVYGTTSVRGGYGAPDHTGDAVVFAADARSGALHWTRALAGTAELYGPVLLDGRLYVATLDTVVELRVSDGAPLRTFVLGSRTGRAGWQNAALARLPGTSRLAHLAGGTVTVLEPASARTATVLTGAHRHIGFDSTGTMWVTVGTDIVKLRLDPGTDTTTSTTAVPAVGGAIGAKYTAGGGHAVYGAPTSPERALHGGAYQVFRKAGKGTKFLWSPATGAHTVKEYGAIGRAWMRADYERGWGWPATDERGVPGGVYQVFVRDGRATKVLWSPATGAHAVKEYGAIGRAWVRAGYERGWGWPLTDEYHVGGEVRQRFSRGVTAHYRAGRLLTS
ncbi:hypothetical protein ACH9EU_05455 [Kocuria sp. M1R5S2]|uniref:LGFP repeat-containing protein n=1 Tax=Kocuria rhizosphaerae TaxID=3376285 RepID=UPI0037BCF8C6